MTTKIFITLSVATPHTTGGLPVTAYVPTDDIDRWVRNGFAHAPHGSQAFPHRSDVCQAVSA